ncbi:MAG: gfo/Idh/MocA family oxidoreductase, partial [Lacipirellulaceae bacterium]
KPLTLTIHEGNQILKVLEETGRVMQVGTMQRTGFNRRFATAAAMARDGRVGNMKRVTVALGGSRSCEPLPVVDVPPQLNWDLYQGPAEVTEYREGPMVDTAGWGAGHPFARTHRYYRWWYEYSGGKLTDWGAHHVDVAMWGLDKLGRDIGKVTIDPQMVKHPVPFKDGMPTDPTRFNCATAFNVLVTFEDGIEMLVTHNAGDLGFGNGVMFQGDRGRYLVNRGKLVGKPVEDLKDNPLPEDAITNLYGCDPHGDHMTNFFHCVESREQPVSDVASHHRMLSICHGINIAMRLGRKLTFDTATDTFVGDDQANTFVQRKQRAGFEIDA